MYIRNILIFLVIVVSSCKKDAATVSQAEALPGVLKYIQQEPRFSLLNQALTRSGLDKSLAEGNVTVFAPPDSAFLQAGWNKAFIDQLTPDSLRFVVSYHIAPGIIGSENIAGFYKTFPLTLNEQHKPNISKNYYGLFFNGNHIDHANLKMGDGLIHELAAVSFPPVDSLLTTLYKQPDLTIFSTIVKKVWNLRSYIQREGLTIIVPNDKAFLDSGYTIDKVNITDTATLIRLCWPYLGNTTLKRLYSSDFVGGKQITTARQPTVPGIPNVSSFRFYISVDGTEIQPVYNDLINGTTGIRVPSPKIVRRNILSKGGIIHTVDQMFRPLK